MSMTDICQCIFDPPLIRQSIDFLCVYVFHSILSIIYPDPSRSSSCANQMNINERTLTTNAQASASSGSTNQSDDQAEPTSAMGIFSLDYKKYCDAKMKYER